MATNYKLYAATEKNGYEETLYVSKTQESEVFGLLHALYIAGCEFRALPEHEQLFRTADLVRVMYKVSDGVCDTLIGYGFRINDGYMLA